jgi:hypothetical protein
LKEKSPNNSRLKYSDPNDTITTSDLIDSVLATAMHATRASANLSLINNTPGSLAFHRGMLLDIPLIADLITIRNSLQAIIDKSPRVANLHLLNHDHQDGEQVLFKSSRLTNSALYGLVPTSSNQFM